MTFDEYCALPALNWSALKDMEVSAKLVRHRRTWPRPETEALAFGQFVHATILEPEIAAATYIVEPDFGDCRIKANKVVRDQWRVDNAGRTPVSAEDLANATNMAAAIREHPVASGLLTGRYEQTITWTDRATGLACKGRVDILQPRRIVDLKTTRAVTLRQFASDAAKYLYYGQVAWYTDGAERAGVIYDPEPPIILAVQSVAPWDVFVYRVADEALDAGRTLYRTLIRRFAACAAADWWPGAAPNILDLQLPPFAPGMIPTSTPEDF